MGERPWFKVEASFYSHPKFLALGFAARGLWVTALGYSADRLTDGFVPERLVAAYQLQDAASELVDAGLFDLVEGGWLLHGWDEYQRSRDEVEAAAASVSEKRSAAGRIGGQRSAEARWGHRGGKQTNADEQPVDNFGGLEGLGNTGEAMVSAEAVVSKSKQTVSKSKQTVSTSKHGVSKSKQRVSKGKAKVSSDTDTDTDPDDDSSVRNVSLRTARASCFDMEEDSRRVLLDLGVEWLPWMQALDDAGMRLRDGPAYVVLAQVLLGKTLEPKANPTGYLLGCLRRNPLEVRTHAVDGGLLAVAVRHPVSGLVRPPGGLTGHEGYSGTRTTFEARSGASGGGVVLVGSFGERSA